MIQWPVVWAVSGMTLAAGLGAAPFVRGRMARVMLAGFLAGLCVYSGIGAAHPDVAPGYVRFYAGLLAGFLAGYLAGLAVFRGVAHRVSARLTPALEAMDRGFLWPGVILTVLLLQAVPLMYPEWRLRHVLNPQPPDLVATLIRRFDSEPTDAINRLAAYGVQLLMPFLYIALYRYRHRLMLVAGILGLGLYLRYVDAGYIGRGPVLQNLLVVLLGAWVLRPRARLRLLAFGAAALGIALIGSYYYAFVRIGSAAADIGPWGAMRAVLADEIDFPRKAGMPVIEAGVRVSLRDYFLWMITLPLPKLFTGAVAGARVNYEMAEFILGRSMGTPGWYIVLPGFVAESVYIYGRTWFWLHGVMAGGLAAWLVRLLGRVPHCLFLQWYVVLLFAYGLNRAGIGSLLPVVINQFLLFYLVAAVLAAGPERRLNSGSHGAM